MKNDRYELGLTGFPLAHSLSPHIHNAALRVLGLEGEYRLYPIPPLAEVAEARAGLQALLKEMRAGNLDGLNVTIPHKQAVVPLLDDLTVPAKATGAVNTILRQGQKLIGDNTDVAGFMTDLRRYLPPGIEDKLALVLGAGGAARAVVYALQQEDWQVIVAARRIEQAQELAAVFQGQKTSKIGMIQSVELACLQSQEFQMRLADRGDGFTLLVNATPLGMSPNGASSPWPPGAAWPRHGLAYDLVYNPQETEWMRAARAAGLAAVGGLGMLVEQAALAFECWTGLDAPRERMAMAANHGSHMIDKFSEEEVS